MAVGTVVLGVINTSVNAVYVGAFRHEFAQLDVVALGGSVQQPAVPALFRLAARLGLLVLERLSFLGQKSVPIVAENLALILDFLEKGLVLGAPGALGIV